MLTFSVGTNHLDWAMKGSNLVFRDFSNAAVADALSEFMDAAMEAVAQGGVVVGSGRDRILSRGRESGADQQGGIFPTGIFLEV